MDNFTNHLVNTQNIALTNKNSEISNKNNTIFQQGQNLQGAENANNSLRSEVSDLAKKNANIQNELDNAKTMRVIEEAKKEVVESENQKLRAVLNRPLMDIINENERLRAAMEKQQTLLEEWILSQKAFKVLAVKYGEKTNVSDDKFAQDINLAKTQIKEGKKISEIKLS